MRYDGTEVPPQSLKEEAQERRFCQSKFKRLNDDEPNPNEDADEWDENFK